MQPPINQSSIVFYLKRNMYLPTFPVLRSFEALKTADYSGFLDVTGSQKIK